MRLVPQDSGAKGAGNSERGHGHSCNSFRPAGQHAWRLYRLARRVLPASVPLALVALVWQWVRLPSLPPRPGAGSSNLVQLMARRHVAFMMASVMLLFMGQFALFTYLRPFLERVTGVTVPVLSSMLLVMGLAGIVGTCSVKPCAPHPPLQRHRRNSACDGADSRPTDRLWRQYGNCLAAVGGVGLFRQRGARRLGHIAQQIFAERRRSWRRIVSGGHTARHNHRCRFRRIAVRFDWLAGHIRLRRRFALRLFCAGRRSRVKDIISCRRVRAERAC